MLKDKYQKLRALQEKKRRNEDQIGISVLEVKYKASYDRIKSEIAEAMQEFCTEMEKELLDLAGIPREILEKELDFSSEAGFEELTNMIGDLNAKFNDPFLKAMLLEFASCLDVMEVKNE